MLSTYAQNRVTDCADCAVIRWYSIGQILLYQGLKNNFTFYSKFSKKGSKNEHLVSLSYKPSQ